ncbi:MAG: segregation/condensation protein A [Candidatus Portiera sp.]|nr:segregation/condensation protein A [Portiera sp.]
MTELAYIAGKPIDKIPEGLYIPPQSLNVFLEEFSGPMDLLLYLVRRHNIDIATINIALIADQYIQYIKMMKEFKMQLAAEYLVMAAILAELKSRILIPATEEEQQEEEVAGSILIAKLREYEKIRDKAEQLAERPRIDRDFFLPFIRWTAPIEQADKILPDKQQLAKYFSGCLSRQKTRKSYEIKLAELSTRERMIRILDKLGLAVAMGTANGFVPFEHLFTKKEGREGVAVSLVAVTQLLKEKLVEVSQSAAYSRLYVYSSITDREDDELTDKSPDK